MGMDVARVGAAFGQDVDPEGITLELLALQVKAQLLAKRRNVLVERLLDLAKDRHPPGQIVERGIGRIARIVVGLAPLLPGLVILGHRIAGFEKLVGVDLLLRQHVELGAIEAGDEEGRNLGHFAFLAGGRARPKDDRGALQRKAPAVSGGGFPISVRG